MKRVVLDTNIFVSLALGGQVSKINDKWRAGKFILVVSEDIVSEYEEHVSVVQADPTDNKFMEAALAGKAETIVSGDKHLLDLKQFRSIPIITAREFMNWLETV